MQADDARRGSGRFAAIADEMADELALDATGHDLHHAWRVFDLGMALVDAEGGDREVVGAAALTHDLHRVVDREGFVHPEETLPQVETILDAAGFPASKVPEVCHCVAVHEEYGFGEGETAAETLEAEIVQDADNLDAMGAVGVARAFQFGGAHGNPMWVPERTFDGISDEPYSPAGTDGQESTLDHFYAKLLRLKEDMNTDAGRDLAAERHEFMERFVERFRAEWRAER